MTEEEFEKQSEKLTEEQGEEILKIQDEIEEVFDRCDQKSEQVVDSILLNSNHPMEVAKETRRFVGRYEQFFDRTLEQYKQQTEDVKTIQDLEERIKHNVHARRIYPGHY